MNHQLNLEKTIVKRTAEIAQKNDDLAKLALFPAHNPNPVLELDFDFNLIYANESALNVFRIPSIFTEKPEEVEKIKRLLKATIKGKGLTPICVKSTFMELTRKD